MVYPAHVIVNFVTSLTFLFTFTKIPSANMAIYSACTLYKRSFSILCFGLSKFSISYQYSKPIQISCYTKNRLKSAVCMRSTHYALTSAASHFIFVSFPFYTPPLKKVRGIMLYPPKKFAFECPSVRPSVCPSVRPSLRLSVRQRFVSGLYLEHLLTDFLQTLYRSLYQEGVVWD